jgi:hypothetical protein
VLVSQLVGEDSVYLDDDLDAYLVVNFDIDQVGGLNISIWVNRRLV